MTAERSVDSIPWPTPTWARDLLGKRTGQGVRVAIIDSGYRPGIVDIPSMKAGHGLVDRDAPLRLAWSDDTYDHIGHGTACCQIIHRLAPAADLIPLRVFGRRLETSPEVLLEAIAWAVQHRCNVVNLSLGTRSEDALRPLYKICQVAHDRGVVLVAALPLGDGPSYPAVFEPVLGVSLADVPSPFDFESCPDAAAEVRSYGRHTTTWAGEARELQGASFAAPQVTGLVARLLEGRPDWGLQEVRRALAEVAETRLRSVG